LQPHLLSRSTAACAQRLAVTSYRRRNYGDASSALQRILERRVIDRPKFLRRHDFQAKKWTSVYKIWK